MLSANHKGAIWMMLSMTAFTVNDVFMKLLATEMPFFQALFIRGLGTSIAMLVLGYVLGQIRWDHSARDWKLIGLRTLAELGAAYFFLSALFHMPLANVSAILQALPLTVTLAGAVFLGEAVGWRRMLAILVGLVGVLLIVRPGGEGFTIYSAYALGAVLCVTVRDIAARQVSREVPSVMIAVVAAFGVTVCVGIASAFITWQPIDREAAGHLLGATVFIIGGYLFSVMAMRSGEISFVAPFRYSSLIVALILGYLVFSDWPDHLTIIGAIIVVATGLFTFHREQQMARRQKQQARGLRIR